MTVKLVERSLTEQRALDHEAEIANPTLHTKHIAIGKNGAVRHHFVGGCRAFDSCEKPLTQLGQGRHELGLKAALSTKLLEEKVCGLLGLSARACRQTVVHRLAVGRTSTG
jgi:hypothetical protein